jgi:zinc ribbon protein
MATNAAPSPVPAPTNCPKCGAPVPSGSHFCNACGAAIGAAPPPPTGAPVDLRQSVDTDRGIIKRLQLLVPGYRGYRQGEDARTADNLLRIQVADRVRNVRSTMENARQALTNASQFQSLTDLAPLISDLQRFEGEVRFAEGGWTGISPAIRMNPPQVDRLYEYDYGFALAADQLSQTVAPLPTMAMAGNPVGVQQLLATARGQVSQLEQAFKSRLQAIEGIQVS